MKEFRVNDAKIVDYNYSKRVRREGKILAHARNSNKVAKSRVYSKYIFFGHYSCGFLHKKATVCWCPLISSVRVKCLSLSSSKSLPLLAFLDSILNLVG